MSFNFDNLRKFTIDKSISTCISLLLFGWVINNILFSKVPYKIGTQKELGLTDTEMRNLKTTTLQKTSCKTSYARFLRFRKKYRNFLVRFNNLGKASGNSLEDWPASNILQFLAVSLARDVVSTVCYNKTENLFIIVLKS